KVHHAFCEVMYHPSTLGCYSATCDAIITAPQEMPFSIEWMLTDYEGIERLNTSQRQVSAPTDVLSFPMWQGTTLQTMVHSVQTLTSVAPLYGTGTSEEPPEPLLIGSVAVCVPWAVAPQPPDTLCDEEKKAYDYPFLQSPPQGLSKASWVFWMLCVHGLLHVHDIHHETPEAFQHMVTLQHTILTRAFSA
ncbi:MAG: rRNA maturation RNAse YbeY, partial [Vampirovibrionales bacterium]